MKWLIQAKARDLAEKKKKKQDVPSDRVETIPPSPGRDDKYPEGEYGKAWGRIEHAMGRGRERARELFAPGDIAGQQADIMKRRKEALGGLSGPAAAALRQKAFGGLESGLQTGLRQLRARQAAAGVRGPAATAGDINLMRQAQEQRRGLEGDILARDWGIQQRALGDYEKSLGRQAFGQLGTELGYAGLGSQLHGQVLADLAQRRLGDIAQSQLEAAQGRKVPAMWDPLKQLLPLGASPLPGPLGMFGSGFAPVLAEKMGVGLPFEAPDIRKPFNIPGFG
jgi:hypothetical protein